MGGRFSFDGDPKVAHRRCPDCGEEHETVTGCVLRDGDRFAVYWADWYRHQEEAWLDSTLGPWVEPAYDGNVTFGCRIGHVDGQDAPACSLVPAAAIRADSAVFGRKLDPDEARRHPWLDQFWALVDWLIEHDATLREHVFELPPRR